MFFLYIVYLLLTFELYAQQTLLYRNAGYVYSINDSVNGSNFSHSNFELGNGSFLVKPYSGNIKIIHNNYTVTLPHTQPELNATPFITAVCNISPSESWLFSDQQIMHLMNDSICKIINIKEHLYSCVLVNKKLVYLILENKASQHSGLWQYDGHRLKKLQDFPFILHSIYFENKKIIVSRSIRDNNKLILYSLDSFNFHITDSIIYNYGNILFVKSIDHITTISTSQPIFVYRYNKGQQRRFPIKFASTGEIIHNSNIDNTFLTIKDNEKRIYSFQDSIQLEALTDLGAIGRQYFKNKESGSFILGTGTTLIRIFPYLKAYPNIYNKSNSNNIFSIQQSKNGTLFLAGYDYNLSILKNNTLTATPITKHRFINGGFSSQNSVFLIGEHEYYGGVMRFDNNTYTYTRLTDSVTGFYLLPTKDKLYFATSQKGLWFTDINNIYGNKKAIWHKITSKDGLFEGNILTLTEDSTGNIWMSHPKTGIAVYNPKKHKIQTLTIEKKEIDFGAMCSLTDTYGMVWLGTSQRGLVYCDKNGSSTLKQSDFHSIIHPLLPIIKKISFIKQWRNFIVLGAGNDILLFDLTLWKEKKQVRIRYLNPLATNFTSETEQNTVLIDNQDSTIWFSTSDMLYNWDIEKWIKLPVTRILPQIVVNGKEAKEHSRTRLSYNDNTLQIKLHYQSADNLPRYTSVSLVNNEDSLIFQAPNLLSSFTYPNLKSDNYTLYIQVCQFDGSISIHKFPIFIDNIFYKKWWFILFNFLLISCFFIWLYIIKRKADIQKKEISELKLLHVLQQVKPHFMLNSLNVLQSEASDKPQSIEIIDRLSDSIDLLFRKNNSKNITHSIQMEWQLILNTIQLAKLTNLKDLEYQLPNQKYIEKLNFNVPICLLQIHVENALKHGLLNKLDGPFLLKIEFEENLENYVFTIMDNGIGFLKSKEINKFSKNGTGIKNCESLLKILNQYNRTPISFIITEDDVPNFSEHFTKVKVEIPKKYKYEYQ